MTKPRPRLVRITTIPPQSNAKLGEVGYVKEENGGELVVQMFKADGEIGACYLHLPSNCVVQEISDDWYAAYRAYRERYGEDFEMVR